VNARSSFVANREAAKPVQPRERALHDPAGAPEPAPVAAIPVGNQGGDAALSELVAVPLRIIAAVALHHVGSAARRAGAPADGRHRIDQVQQLRDVGPIGGGQRRDERNPVGVGENMMLRAGLAAIGWVRSSFFPPRIARSEELSTIARARSSRPRWRNSASRVVWSCFQTPARCHRTSRRQQVTPEPQPISRGNIRQGMPLRSTKRIPVSTARSGMGVRPAYCRFRARLFGKSGSIRVHKASSSNACGMPDRLRVGQATVPSLNQKYKRLIG
jgi:hypothetical protein